MWTQPRSQRFLRLEAEQELTALYGHRQLIRMGECSVTQIQQQWMPGGWTAERLQPV